MNLSRPIAFIDIESTGVDPVKDRIIEIGVAVLYPDGVRSPEIFVRRFNPGREIPQSAIEVHGITDDAVRDAPPFSASSAGILRGLQGKDIAGYNLRRFDLPILDEELRRSGLKLDLTGVRVIDCYGIFAKKEPRKLEDAVKRYCGRDHVLSHGAGSDADATLDVLLGQLEAYEDLAKMDLSELAKFSQIEDLQYADLAQKLYYDQDGKICYAFGKHKDCRVRDRMNYAEWMLANGFPGSTCDVLREILGIRQ